jgi:hypothetical protein
VKPDRDRFLRRRTRSFTIARVRSMKERTSPLPGGRPLAAGGGPGRRISDRTPRRGQTNAASMAVVKLARTPSDRRLAIRRIPSETCVASARVNTSRSNGPFRKRSMRNLRTKVVRQLFQSAIFAQPSASKRVVKSVRAERPARRQSRFSIEELRCRASDRVTLFGTGFLNPQRRKIIAESPRQDRPADRRENSQLGTSSLHRYVVGDDVCNHGAA